MLKFNFLPFAPTILLLILVTTAGVGQSPWTQSKSGFYAQASVQAIPTYNQLFNGFEVIDLEGKFSEQSFQVYGEYGFSRKWTGVVATAVRRVNRFIQNPGDLPEDHKIGLGNTTLGIRRGFSAGGLQWAGAVHVDLPVKTTSRLGLLTGFDAYTVRPMLSAGKGNQKLYWYIYTGGGIRTNEYADFVQTGGELGYRIKKVLIIGFTEWMQSLENGDRSVPGYLTSGLSADAQSWWSYGLKSVIKTGRFTGFVLSVGGAAYGKNVANRPALGLGYYFKWE